MKLKRIKRSLCLILAGILICTEQYDSSAAAKTASAPKKIIMNRKKVKLTVGKTFKLKVKSVKPKKSSKAVTYKSSKKKIATVNKKGVIKAKKAGKTKIMVVSKKNKNVRAKVNITVKKKKTNNNAQTPEPIVNLPTASAQPTDNNLQTKPIILYDGKMTAPIIMDSGYKASDENMYAERGYRQIARAVTDLRQDIAMVTGAIDYKEVQAIFNDSVEAEEERLYYADSSKVPELVTDTTVIKADYAIIAGTIDDSEIIKNLMNSGKLDEAKALKGAWEGYVIKQVKNPIKGVDNALVIAGSDVRGTIYGIYTISEEIGVSPFYWYSDVPVAVKEKIEFDAVTPIVEDGPDVKYRGIFINDEEASNKWAKIKFTEDGTKAPGVNYYRKVFELILRMKANTLWPAMHGCSTAFNKVVDEYGESVNAKEASEYGIVMSASHCEILLRNNVGEWADWFNQNKGRFSDVQHPNDYSKAYDFTLNRDIILEYWKDRLIANKDYENILTVGIRGPHDEAFNCERLDIYEGSNESQKKVAMMQDVISCQRELIAEIYGEENVQNIPQVLIPYKEVNDVYNSGLNEFMLWDGSQDYNGDGIINYKDDNTDIMIMWAEDNENYLRQDLTDEEADRKGGAGIYYHISYWGPPSSYLWLNSTSLYVMSEQMHRAYNIGANDYWILNVGDIKPSEPSMEFFMKMGWDSKYWNDTTVTEYLKKQSMRDYGLNEENADTMAEAVSEYYQMNGTRKAEFYARGDYNTTPDAFSATANGDEALLWIERSKKIVQTLEKLYNNLSDDYKDAFYEQFYYNVLSLNDIIENFGYYEKHRIAASQGRVGSAKVYAQLSKDAAERVRNRKNDFNSCNENKWTAFMDYDHPGRGYQLVGDGGEKYLEVYDIQEGIGASCENSSEEGKGTLRFSSLIKDQEHYFDVFDKNTVAEKWVAQADAEWINLSMVSGKTNTEQRVIVTVDWTKVSGKQTGTIYVYNADDSGKKTGSAVAAFTVESYKNSVEYGEKKGYIEACGYVSIEAEHYSDMLEGDDGSYWGVIKSNGHMSDTMKALDDTAKHTTDWDSTARLIYNVYFENAGTYTLTMKRLPVLNEGKENGTDRSMDIAVGAGYNTPVTLKGTRFAEYGNWTNILNMSETLKCNITVNKGWNEIVVYRSDASFVFDKMVIETIKGALPKSVLGPQESPNNICDAVQVKTARLPKELGSYAPGAVIVMGDLNNVGMNQNESKSVDCMVYATNGSKVTVTAVSENEEMLTAELNGNKLILTSKEKTGSVMVSVTVSAEGCTEVKQQFRVNVRNASLGGFYIEAKGEVVINAADAILETPYSWTEVTAPGVWEITSDKNGVRLSPDINTQWNNTNDLSDAPALNFKVKISLRGTYYMFANMSNPNNNADSYHVIVDGVYRYTHSDGDMSGKKIWRSAGKGIELTEGEHTITIAAREDGIVMNQILFTTNKDKALKDGTFEPVSAQKK